MKLFSFLVLLILSAQTLYAQNTASEATAKLLQNNTWEPYRVTELFNGETIVYIDSCAMKNLRAGQKCLGGSGLKVYPKFHHDSVYVYEDSISNDLKYYRIATTKATWKLEGTALIMESDQRTLAHTPVFLGTMEIVRITDSELIVKKYIDRPGNWTRTFHFKKKIA